MQLGRVPESRGVRSPPPPPGRTQDRKQPIPEAVPERHRLAPGQWRPGRAAVLRAGRWGPELPAFRSSKSFPGPICAPALGPGGPSRALPEP